jgi:hypothetical protein
MVMIALAVWLPVGADFGWRGQRAAFGPWVPAVVLLFFYIVETPYVTPLTGNRPQVTVRARVSDRVRDVRERVPPDASLYVISLVRDNGFMETLLRYELAPARVTFGSLSSAAELQREVQAHDYMFVFSLKPGETTRLGGAFGSGETLFAVESAGGRIRLVPAP